MNVIKYNVNSGDVCQIGRQYEYGKTQVIFEGYQVIDSANEIYFKFVGRTEESKYLIPIVDMTLDITQQLTKHVGQFSCQLEEMNTEGTLVSQSPVFYVAVKRSIKVGADYEVQDPRLETIYQKYNEMYNIISQTNETSLANESQRQAEWLTLKQEVSDAIDRIYGSLDTYKAETTQMLESNLAEYERQTTSNISTALETYETQTDSNINVKLTAYQSKTTSDINRMFDDSDRTSKQKIDALVSELDQRRLAGEFNGENGYSPSAKVEPTTGGVEITITDISGTTKEKVLNGKNGVDGSDYVITDADKNEIADNVKASVNTEINELKSNLTGLQTVVESKADKTDLAKTNLYLDALYKINKGQTYDVLEQESEAYSVDVPSGAKYVGIDKVGGKSVVWNQMICSEAIGSGGTLDIDGGVYTLTPNISSDFSQVRFYNATPHTRKSGHKYYVSIEVKSDAWASDGSVAFCTYDGLWLKDVMTSIDPSNHSWQKLKGIFTNTTDANGSGDFCFRKYYEETNSPVSVKNAVLFDLTQMFGTTIADYIYSLEDANAGAGVAWFKKLFPADYYPYSEPTIISSQTDRVDVASADSTVIQQITTGFPALNSAGSAYDYIDLNEGKLHQRIGKVVIDGSQAFDDGVGVGEYGNVVYISTSKLNIKLPKGKYYGIISDRFNNLILDSSIGYNIPLYDMTVYNTGNLEIGWNYLAFCLPSTVTSNELAIEWFSNNPTTVYCELAEEIITDITIPTELSDWLTVEAGGSITFHNADDGKRLLIPSKLSFVRKLDEVTV